MAQSLNHKHFQTAFLVYQNLKKKESKEKSFKVSKYKAKNRSSSSVFHPIEETV
jgi:hypothetical protein